jgi:hypothetical protein
VYTFTRTGPTTSALTVNFTVGGTATLGTDYTGISATGTTKTVTFAAGSATATVTVDPTADMTIEPDETVILTLASGTGYKIGTTTTVTGTIMNATVVQNTRMVMIGRTPGGLRGLVTTFTVKLTDAAGRPLANQTVRFSDRCDFYVRQGLPNGERNLGSIQTNASGEALLRYTIPPNTNADNVDLIARFAGTPVLKASSFKVRVEIGRTN